jgi:hypothetical protein
MENEKRISCISIKAVAPNSEKHNQREVVPEYIKHFGLKNESFIEESIDERFEKITSLYKKSTGQKMQKKATPIREAVVVLNENHTMDDMEALSNSLKENFNIRTFQIYIHRDEGHIDEEYVNKINYHAHLVIDWTDEKTGKTIKLNKEEFARVQDVVAESLGMQRGKVNSKSERLEHKAYRQEMLKIEAKRKEWKEEQEKQWEQEKEEALRQQDALRLKQQQELSILKKDYELHKETINTKIGELLELNDEAEEYAQTLEEKLKNIDKGYSF